MRIKLDENLGESIAQMFRVAGHEVETVASENLWGIPDRDLISVCQREERCLVTLDMDFANPLVFRPSDYFGIAVLRLPAQATLEDIKALVQTLIDGLSQAPIKGNLWIVQKKRIRVYQPEPESP
ncbi:hypothetical protein HRbin15_00038 [bacterium HR15]|nr:hypothetical protein HRbin15_00038 [bacterium HR15]